MRKTFAVILSFTLLFSTSAYALDNESTANVLDNEAYEILEEVTEESSICADIIGTEYEDAARYINETKIMSGYPDGTFRPYERISRAEFAVVIPRLLSIDHVAKVANAEEIFKDVSATHWAVREVKLISNKKIFNGFEDQTFRPEEFVTYNQAIKVLVGALGYGEQAMQKGGWSVGYKMVANELGLLEGVCDSGDNEINRGTAAKLLKNAMQVTMPNGKTLESMLGERFFYVSPKGNDTNPGTEEAPWKTLHKAAQTAIAGTTVIFEDGTYNEEKVTTVTNSGEEGAPITFKARNKHKAIIKYPKTFSLQTKFQITAGKDYINVRDLLFTQVERAASSTSDIYLRCLSDHCEFTGNKFENVFEEGIKLVQADYILIEDNEFMSIPHEGMDIFNSSNVTIKNNYLYNCTRVGIMIKGNSRNCQIYNNYVLFDGVNGANSSASAITLGGSSNNYDPFDIGYGTGFEGYYLVAYNNVLVAKGGTVNYGIGFSSSKGCMAFNNVIVGFTYGLGLAETNAMDKGWEWDPPVVDPFIKNNIIANATTGIKFTHKPEGKLTCDNNIFYNVMNVDIGGSVEDPQLVDLLSDWMPKEGSPTIDKGGEVPSEIVGYDGQVIKFDMTDYAGNARSGKWDIGIYSVGN